MTDEFDTYDRIRILWPDHLGLARGKYLPSGLAHHGTGFCASTFGLTYARDIIAAPGACVEEGLKDVHGTVDIDTLRPSWEDDRTGIAIADLTLGGDPYEVSSRWALKRAISEWAALGYRAKIGIELEGYLLEPPDGGGGRWGQFRNPRSFVYGTGPLGDPSGFFDEVLWTAERCGFPIESSNVEFEESQFEFTLRYDDALRAVDDTFLFRVMAREVAIRRGLDFTFLGKPFPRIAGSGVHFNFSFADDAGNPALADHANEHGTSELALACLAGLVEHHQGITALCAPTINSYRRLKPGTLAGCWADWGVDHREATNRVPAETGPAMRIEHRLADGAVSLHLGAAAILQAARLGAANKLEAPPPVTGDSGDDRARSATTLAEALDDLEADQEVCTAVGDELVQNFLFVKRHEVQKFTDTGESIETDVLTDFEYAMYLPYH